MNTMLPYKSTGNVTLQTFDAYLGFQKVNTPYPTDGTDGHGVRDLGHEKQKMRTDGGGESKPKEM